MFALIHLAAVIYKPISFIIHAPESLASTTKNPCHLVSGDPEVQHQRQLLPVLASLQHGPHHGLHLLRHHDQKGSGSCFLIVRH